MYSLMKISMKRDICDIRIFLSPLWSFSDLLFLLVCLPLLQGCTDHCISTWASLFFFFFFSDIFAYGHDTQRCKDMIV